MVKILREKSKGNECSILFFCKNSPYEIKSKPPPDQLQHGLFFLDNTRDYKLCVDISHSYTLNKLLDINGNNNFHSAFTGDW